MQCKNFFLNKKYVELYLKDNEEVLEFDYSAGEHFFYNIAIKSPIPNTKFYDLNSPYGYSGYYTNTENIDFIKQAMEHYSKKVNQENIIAEFIRFHPTACNAKNFQFFLDFFSDGKPIVEVETDLEKRWQAYGSKERNKMRKSLKDFQVKQSFDFDQFYNLYIESMKKKEASDFYHFSKKYFQRIVNMDNSIMLEARQGNILHSMSIFLFDSHSSYYHLTANSSHNISQHSGATRAILETFFQKAEKLNIPKCILGGGLTNNPDDSLFRFKKQFSPIIRDFYVGGKIYNSDIYENLVQNKKNNYFLAYRFH